MAKSIVDAAYTVHREIGPGLIESVYEACFAHELMGRGLQIQRQVVLPVRYKGLTLETGLRLDVVVENLVIVELKAVDKLLPVHQAQVLTYLKLSGLAPGAAD